MVDFLKRQDSGNRNPRSSSLETFRRNFPSSTADNRFNQSVVYSVANQLSSHASNRLSRTLRFDGAASISLSCPRSLHARTSLGQEVGETDDQTTTARSPSIRRPPQFALRIDLPPFRLAHAQRGQDSAGRIAGDGETVGSKHTRSKHEPIVLREKQRGDMTKSLGQADQADTNAIQPRVPDPLRLNTEQSRRKKWEFFKARSIAEKIKKNERAARLANSRGKAMSEGVSNIKVGSESKDDSQSKADANSKEDAESKAQPKPESLPLTIEGDVLSTMRTLTSNLAEHELRWRPDHHSFENRVRDRRYHVEDMQSRNEELQQSQMTFSKSQRGEAFNLARASLPMYAYKSRILDVVDKDPVVIIMGDTGSGKTTQIPQYLLDRAITKGVGAHCNIICTQPRRAAAVHTALRVAEERGQSIGDSVGYLIRYGARPPKYGGSIWYQTCGVLLASLSSGESVYDSFSHIIVDEVHERSIENDHSLNLLRSARAEHLALGKSFPRIILMSASMDPVPLQRYFEDPQYGGRMDSVPVIRVPGRQFSVSKRYLEDIMEDLKQSLGPTKFTSLSSLSKAYLSSENNVHAISKWVPPLEPDLVAATIARIVNTSQDGGILVFLPGAGEIEGVRKALESGSWFGVNFKDQGCFKITPFYSKMPQEEQDLAFASEDKTCRKIILATNIAQTSLTIPDVQYVVDGGKRRHVMYQASRRVTEFATSWISHATAQQRAGRAGRVQDGHYYALYSTARRDTFQPYDEPDILNSSLQNICLNVKASTPNADVNKFLAASLDAPAAADVATSLAELKRMQAITSDDTLSSFGAVLALLPCDAEYARMIVLGILFRCLDPMLIIAATDMSNFPFINNKDPAVRLEAKAAHLPYVEDTFSDHVALVNMARRIRLMSNRNGAAAAMRYCRENFVNVRILFQAIRLSEELAKTLERHGLIPFTKETPEDSYALELGPPHLNENSGDINIMRALVLASKYPNMIVRSVIRTSKDKFIPTYRHASEKGRIWIASSSKNQLRRHAYERTTENSNKDWRTGTVFAYNSLIVLPEGEKMVDITTACSPMVTLLFGGKAQPYTAEGQSGMEFDNWLRMPIVTPDLDAVHAFREVFDKAIMHGCNLIAESRVKVADSAYLRDHDKHDRLAADPALKTLVEGTVNLLRKSAGLDQVPEEMKGLLAAEQDVDIEVSEQRAAARSKALDLLIWYAAQTKGAEERADAVAQPKRETMAEKRAKRGIPDGYKMTRRGLAPQIPPTVPQ